MSQRINWKKKMESFTRKISAYFRRIFPFISLYSIIFFLVVRRADSLLFWFFACKRLLFMGRSVKVKRLTFCFFVWWFLTVVVCTCSIQFCSFINKSGNREIAWSGDSMKFPSYPNKVDRNSHKSSKKFLLQKKIRSHTTEFIKSNRCYTWNDDKHIVLVFLFWFVYVDTENKFSIPSRQCVFLCHFHFYGFYFSRW